MLLDEDDSIDERLWEERRNTMTPSVRSARNLTRGGGGAYRHRSADVTSHL